MNTSEMPSDNCCYLCNECPKTFPTLCELQWHLGEDHVRDKPPHDTSESSLIDCKIETRELEKCKTENKEEEMLTPEEDNAMEILASSSDFSSTDELLGSPPITPTQLSHISNTSSIVASGSYACLKCTRIFSCRDQLNIHYTHTHRDKPQYVCEICEKVFAVKRELSTHSRIHEGIEPHKCAQCGKEFGTRQLLKKHNMWHTGERSHVCETCGKAFFQKGHLTQHLMIHKGGRPHQCRLCEKTFIFKFDLNRHMKIHAERGHACQQCGKCFPKKSNLDEHSIKCTNKNSSINETSKNDPLMRSPPQTSFSPPPAKRPALSNKTSPKVIENPSIGIMNNKTSPMNTISSNQSGLIHHQNIMNQNAPKFPFSPIGNELEISKMAKLLMAQQFSQQQQTQKHQLVAQNLSNFFKQQTNNDVNNSAFSALYSMARLNPALFPMPIKPITPTSNLFYCFVCNKNLENQASYMLHWSIVHLKSQSHISANNNAQDILSNNTRDYENQQQQFFSQKFPLMKIEELSSESATSSSCASSPQKASPISTSHLTHQNSIKTNTTTHHSPCENTISEETPTNVEADKISKNNSHCHECDASRDRESILTQQLSLAQAEVERLKQLVQQVIGSILGGSQQQQQNNSGDLAAALLGTGIQTTMPELEKSWMLRAK